HTDRRGLLEIRRNHRHHTFWPTVRFEPVAHPLEQRTIHHPLFENLYRQQSATLVLGEKHLPALARTDQAPNFPSLDPRRFHRRPSKAPPAARQPERPGGKQPLSD